ncbi:hypothetical protein BaRGS_00032280 [Batillaria attramentaria]|uniref:Uncharacterized protein n=1 Tax=Batillaria attramentaria TaxID=370345 RepID=A0ABD0JP61_9CAEN
MLRMACGGRCRPRVQHQHSIFSCNPTGLIMTLTRPWHWGGPVGVVGEGERVGPPPVPRDVLMQSGPRHASTSSPVSGLGLVQNTRFVKPVQAISGDSARETRDDAQSCGGPKTKALNLKPVLHRQIPLLAAL